MKKNSQVKGVVFQDDGFSPTVEERSMFWGCT